MKDNKKEERKERREKKKKKKQQKKENRHFIRHTVFSLITVLILNIAGSFPGFCDFYTDHIYVYPAAALGFITSLVPFAIGEIVMYILALSVLSTAITLVLFIFLHRHESFRHHTSNSLKSLVRTAVNFLFTYTLFWTIPIRGTHLGHDIPSSAVYETADILELRNYLAAKTNAASRTVPRNEKGSLILEDADTMNRHAAEGMKKYSYYYTRLDHYCPPIKNAICSDVLDWMDIGGYTYPYTMEMTQNKYCSRLYQPLLYAHELCHHLGYYKESEANFLSCIGCAASDDPIVSYYAYFEMYYYLDKAYRTSIPDETLRGDMTALDDQVWIDIRESQEEAAKLYASEYHPLERFKPEAEKAATTGWSTQGKILGAYSYDGVINLLMRFYGYEGK